MHDENIHFLNMSILDRILGSRPIKIEIDLGRVFRSFAKLFSCYAQYLYKYAFFEIFTILKSDYPKNYS